MTRKIARSNPRNTVTFTVAVPYQTSVRQIDAEVFGDRSRDTGMWPDPDTADDTLRYGWTFRNFRRFSGRGILEARDDAHTHVTLVLEMPLFFTSMIPAIFRITVVLIVSWFSFFLILLFLLLFESPLAPLVGILTALHPPLLVLMPLISDLIYRAGAKRLFYRLLTENAGTDDESRLFSERRKQPDITPK